MNMQKKLKTSDFLLLWLKLMPLHFDFDKRKSDLTIEEQNGQVNARIKQWLESDYFKKKEHIFAGEVLIDLVLTTQFTGMYRIGGKAYIEEINRRQQLVEKSNILLSEAANLRGHSKERYLEFARQEDFKSATAHIKSEKNSSLASLVFLLTEAFDHFSQTFCAEVGKRGAAINDEGAWRGFICNRLDKILPEKINNQRYKLIAGLAALAGIEVDPKKARSIIMQNRERETYAKTEKSNPKVILFP